MNLDTKGMQAASLTSAQISELKEAEKKLNAGKGGPEIYLLAVSRTS